MKIEVGNQYRYRVNKGRGRPAVGEAIYVGNFVTMRNLRSGKPQNVSLKAVTAEYEFTPYRKRG